MNKSTAIIVFLYFSSSFSGAEQGFNIRYDVVRRSSVDQDILVPEGTTLTICPARSIRIMSPTALRLNRNSFRPRQK